MSRLVSKWESKGYQPAEIKGYMTDNGEIHYNFERSNRNLGTMTDQEKENAIKDFQMVQVFNNEEEAKEEFELLGFLL